MPFSRRDIAGLSLGAVSSGTLSAPAASAADHASPGAPEPAGGRDGILVPEHFVPTPRTISPQAQAFLRHKPPIGAPPVPTSRDDAAGWKAYKDAGNGGMIAITKAHARRFPAEVVHHELGPITVYEVTPKNLADANADVAIVYVHGGGFVVGGGEAAIYPAIQMAGMANARVFSVDYRMAPEFPFPTPMEDTLAAYRFLLKRYKPENLALFGPSAGANLVPAAMLKARALGLPLPAALALHSCPSDLSQWGDSGYTNFEVDTVLRQPLPEISASYAHDHDPTDPYVSPVFGDYSQGFPPTVLTSGTRDLLLSDTVRLHRAMVRGGVKAELHVWEAMTHAPFFGAPEEEELYMQHISFMLRHMRNA